MFNKILHSKIAIGVIVFLFITSLFTTIYAYQQPVEITQERVLYTYTTRGVFNYIVILYPNTVYDTSTLLNPGKVFLKLVDKVIVNTTYMFNSMPQASSINNTLEIRVILSHLQVWSKVLNSTTVRTSENIAQYVIELDIPWLISLARNISSQIEISSTRYIIVIDCNAKTDFEVMGISQSVNFPYSLQITIDLSGKIMEFSQREISTTSVKKNTVISETTLPLGFVNISTRLFQYISIISTCVISVAMVIFTGVNIMYTYRKKPGNISRITRRYRSVIVEACEILNKTGNNVVKVQDFQQLVKVSETLAKPVIHVKTSDKHVFYVLDEEVTYLYEQVDGSRK
ncbi:MAG: DUF5305 family protein [Desulfurococcaceae archaeon]